MIRTIIQIDSEKCNGCGACARACHEGAIGMVNGKARLLREDYCDGLGDCLPSCPTGAISFVQKEAAAYNESAAAEHQKHKFTPHSGCPGSRMQAFSGTERLDSLSPAAFSNESALGQWPCQIRLVPANAPFLDQANLLIAADCTAYAYASLHRDFMKNRITLIGCPKLDSVDYSEKLGEILRTNSIQSVTVLRMEVPCCGGLEHAVRKALQISQKQIPLQVITFSIQGNILNS